MAAFFFSPAVQVWAERPEVLETPEVIVLFDPGIEQGAKNVAKIYTEIKAETQDLFGWTYNRKPFIVLINNRDRFLMTADHPITIAYAVPERNLVVIDYSKVVNKPFSLENTLTHEFCHLLLHDHITGIPRWLDEGLCQWAGGGLDEIIYNTRQSALNRASMTGDFIPFERLESGFPGAEQARILAYEQSKSFITYLGRQFGEDRLFELLGRMAQGERVNEAFYEVYQKRLDQMEILWRESIRKDLTWITYVSHHMYELLFVAGALLTVIGFLKFIWRKHHYQDEDLDE